MALSDILTTLRSEAAAELAAIAEMHERELRAIEDKHAAHVAERSAQARADQERRVGKVTERILAKARHHVSFVETERANTAVEAVFDRIKSKLWSLSEAAYATYLKKQWQTLPPLAKPRFVVAKERETETVSFLREHGVLDDAITVAGDLGGGFLAIAEAREYDCTFRALLLNIRTNDTVAISQQISAAA